MKEEQIIVDQEKLGVLELLAITRVQVAGGAVNLLGVHTGCNSDSPNKVEASHDGSPDAESLLEARHPRAVGRAPEPEHVRLGAELFADLAEL